MDKREDLSGPICRKLMELKEKGPVPFHMPGHKRKNAGPFPDAQACDITEITGCDDLHDPRGMIRESMDILRETYASRESWYLVNGSTAGILAAMSAACRSGDRILMARNCHKSVYNGIRLLRLRPVYLRVQPDPDYEIAGMIDPEEVKRQLALYPDIRAVIVTSPTYEGVVSDIQMIRELMDEQAGKEIPLIVDEAHGAHMIFHSYFPESAVRRGADLVVQSAHKTLPSLTQTGLLHLCSHGISPDLLQDRLSLFETSSPSYILMASAEYGVVYTRENPEKVQDYVSCLKAIREKCRDLGLIRLVENDDGRFYDLDPGKLVFYAKDRGRDLFRRLREDYQIEAEMAQKSYVVCMTSLMDDPEDYDLLLSAIREIDGIYQKERRGGAFEAPAEKLSAGGRVADRKGKEAEFPERVYYAWECEEMDAERIPLADGPGRIAARDIMIYPPGVPLITAGERFGKEIVEKLLYSLYNGYHVVGLVSDPDETKGDPFILCIRE